jgi:PKD repeat protein
MRPVRTCWSVAARGAVALLALVCALAGAASAQAAATCGTDPFDGSALDARWSVTRPAAGAEPVVAGGTLQLPIRTGDLIGGTASAQNIVTQETPAGGWTATTELDTSALDVNGEQAGLVLWKSEGAGANSFGKIVAIRNNAGAYGFEAVWTEGSAVAVPTGVSGVTLPSLPADVLLRVRSDGSVVTAEYSADAGATWVQIGKQARYEGALRAGVVAMGGSAEGTGGTVAFDRFTLTCAPTVTASATQGTAPLAVNFTSAGTPAGATLTWDFGDGTTAAGGTTASHTFTQSGAYRVTLAAKTADGDLATGSATVVVRTPGSLQASDEFNGNALDPKWELLRPRLTGLRVSDGHLRLQSYGGDMHGGNASARNIVLQPLGTAPVTASTRIDVSGLTATGDQAGMLVWRSESPNSFAKIVFNRRGSQEYWFERSRTDGTGTAGGNAGSITGPVPGAVHLRIRSSGGDNPTFTPESSVDGFSWSAVGQPFQLPGSGAVKIGLTYFSADAYRIAAFDWFRMAPNLFTTIGITREATRANGQIRGGYTFKGEEMPPSRTVGPAPNDTVDDVPLRMPDTTGNVANLAEYRGQTLDLREELQKPYTKIHFFGTTTDGSGGGDFTLRFDDGTTQVVQDVNWPDWCQSGTPAAHIAVGPLSGRWTTTGQDGAGCSIFHFPATIAAANQGKKLVAVTLPPSTDGSGADARAYLMALTLESGDGSFDMPDLSGTLTIPNDKIAPVSNVSFEPAEPDGNDGWYTSPVLVTIDAQDEDGGAGVEQTLWRLGSGVQQAYGGPFLLTTEGEHTFEYRAIDAAGNAEGFKAVPIKLDPNAPSTTAAVFPAEPFGTNGWHDGAVTLRLTANDDQGSGVAGTEYRVDGGDWTAYAGGVVVEKAGTHVVEYRSSDVAGNLAIPASVAVKVDKTPPVTSARINGAAPVDTYVGTARIAFTRTDGEGSGTVATEYRIGADGAWTPYTGAFDLTAVGGYRIDFRSRDLVGNTENFRTLLLRVEPAPITPAGDPPAPPAPDPVPFAALEPVERRLATKKALRRGDFGVRISCQDVEQGTVQLRVSRAVAKRLGLRGRVLAKRSVRCGSGTRAAVTLRPRRAVRRALKRADGRVAASLVLRMQGADGTARDRMAVVLRGR